MRRSLLILGVLGCACTATATEEELELLEAEAEAEYASLRVVPDAREDGEAGPPVVEEELESAPVRIVVSRFSFEEDPMWGEGSARCPFEVRTVGFPAIEQDGGAIANLSSGVSGPSEGEDETVSFTVLEVETRKLSRYETLVQGTYDRDKYDCWRWYKKAKAQAAEINETLAEGWRPLRELPVEVDPSLAPYPDEGVEEEVRPGSARPVQLTLLNRQVVFRVPGVKVLSRSEDDWTRPEDDDPAEGMCWYHDAHPYAVFADDQTGVAMIEVGYESGPCMCESVVGHEIVRLEPETIAEIDRRGALAAEAAEADE